MKKEHIEILNLKSIDPLAVAETITGKDYKTDEGTTWMGLAIQMQKSKEMQWLLQSIGDTSYGMKTADYINAVSKFGFEIIYSEEFSHDGNNNTMYVMWLNDLSILLKFDTYGENVNSGDFYYNWSPNGSRDRLTSSGHFLFEKTDNHQGLYNKDFTPFFIPNYPKRIEWESGMPYEQWKALSKPVEEEMTKLYNAATLDGKRQVWVGGHDCREALITNIKALFENGVFLKEWKECPFSWLTNYYDHKDSNARYPFTSHYDKTRKIISQFPIHVQNAIGQYRP